MQHHNTILHKCKKLVGYSELFRVLISACVTLCKNSDIKSWQNKMKISVDLCNIYDGENISRIPTHVNNAIIQIMILSLLPSMTSDNGNYFLPSRTTLRFKGVDSSFNCFHCSRLKLSDGIIIKKNNVEPSSVG